MADPLGKAPLDRRRYKRDKRSQPIRLGLPDGCYVFVQDLKGVIHVLPDGQHAHPRVLGHASPAIYAGDLTICADSIVDVTNCSGTFQFTDKEGLLAVANSLQAIGFTLQRDAVRWFSHLDAARPLILR